MADFPTAEFAELRSAAADLTTVLNELTEAKKQETAASKEAADADKKKASAANSVGGALGKFVNATLGTVNAVYGLAKTFASIAESGRQFAEKTGATATRGAQFQLDLNKIVLQDARKFGADQQVIAEQIQGAATSFADAFVGAAAGMQISARGSAEFARSLNVGFKSEFTLTAQSMKALITVGAATTKEFDAFRKASGRAGLSSGQFANLVNKNSLSFMLYGPSFARAAVSAERLGINLASVQRAQESMVTNLDGTIDTIAQLNQLGANIDFGSLVTMAETQGPEATLKYLQSTIPPSLFQSASTRALISKLGIPLEDLLKQQGSKQESAANRIEQAFSEVAAPAGAMATSLANLNKDIKAIETNKLMEIMNGAIAVVKSLYGLVIALMAFGAAVIKATISLLNMPGGVGGGLKDMLTKLGGVALVAGGLYTGYKGAQWGSDAVARGETGKGVGIGAGMGALGGAAIGVGGAMLTGAAIGSAVPILGTAIGALIGGGAAYFIGRSKKKKMEEEQRLADAQLSPGATAIPTIPKTSNIAEEFNTLDSSTKKLILSANELTDANKKQISALNLQRTQATVNANAPMSVATTRSPINQFDVTSGITQNSMQMVTRNNYLTNSSLEKRIDELVMVLRDAKTTIQVGDSTQQVPRMSVARVGAYERFGRPS
jgi:uncharacterized protein YfiM (DUF2279 family)